MLEIVFALLTIHSVNFFTYFTVKRKVSPDFLVAQLSILQNTGAAETFTERRISTLPRDPHH